MNVYHPGSLVLEPSIWVCSRKRKGKLNPRFRVKLLGRGAAIHTVKVHDGTDRGGPKVVSVAQSNCPPAECLYRVIRAWWLSRDVMAAIPHKSYYFVLEPCGEKWVLSLCATATANNALAHHMRKHGIVLSSTAPKEWEDVGVMLCEFFARHAQRNQDGSRAADRESNQDTTALAGYTAVVAERLAHLY